MTFGAVEPRHVVGMPAGELAAMMHVSMEIEDPILDYSRQTGEAFRVLLPPLGRFIGKHEEQTTYAAEQSAPWCESPWCAEERRHASTFARLIERLTGTAPVRDNPNRPMAVTSDEDAAVRLLAGRQSSEWNASSIYLVLAAHASGDLHTVIRNIARDEIKHLGIMSAADAYLLGPRPWRRFADMTTQALTQYRGHQARRSAGACIDSNPASAFEVIVAHLVAERRLRR